MSEFAVIYEQADDGNWSARAADLPVYSSARTRAEVETSIREAIALHLECLEESGRLDPVPVTFGGTVSVPLPARGRDLDARRRGPRTCS